MEALFLPGVPEAYVRRRLEQAAGGELSSGKFDSADSSAALAANAFGWFITRPAAVPTLPGTEVAGRADQIEIEYCARFPWAGGRHSWLDVVLISETHLIGVESKRFEPFRDAPKVKFSPAYERPVWGNRMGRYCAIRDALGSGTLRYRHLDAAQLVKHAYGLVTQGRRIGRDPILFYLFAEPAAHRGRIVSAAERERHRKEVADFSTKVAGDEVVFCSASYREWLSCASGDAADHAAAVIAKFDP